MPPKRRKNVSVNRLSLIPPKLALRVAEKHAAARGHNFYGFAQILAQRVRETGANARGTPDLKNPFHADIQFPPDEGKDFILNIARQLAERAQFAQC